MLNVLRIIGLMILVAGFFVMFIIVGIKKKKESQQSILLRILTNYLQLLSATLSFNMKFPKVLTEMFYPIQKVGASSEAFLSIDCFFRDAEIKAFTPSNAIFKVFLTGLLPILLILAGVLVWSLLYLISKKHFGDVYRNIIVTTIVLLFLLHPTLSKVGFEIFQCVKVGEDDYQARLDMDMGCYSWRHIKW